MPASAIALQRNAEIAPRCGASARSAISLPRFFGRFPAGFRRGGFGGAHRPPGCGFPRGLRSRFPDRLPCSSLPAWPCSPPRGGGTLSWRSVSSRDRRDHHGIGNKAIGRKRDVGRGPLIHLWRRLIRLQGMIGGVRGDAGDILHRVGDFFPNRFGFAHGASKGAMIGLTGAEPAGSRNSLTPPAETARSGAALPRCGVLDPCARRAARHCRPNSISAAAVSGFCDRS
jgi:hypothetical protein